MVLVVLVVCIKLMAIIVAMGRVSDVGFVRKIILAALLLPLSLDLSLHAVQGYLPGAALRLPLGFHDPIHDRSQEQQQINYQAKHARLITRSRLKATEEAKQEGAKQVSIRSYQHTQQEEAD